MVLKKSSNVKLLSYHIEKLLLDLMFEPMLCCVNKVSAYEEKLSRGIAEFW